MAKEIFITQWLSEQMISAGETLIKRLDDTDSKVQAAFWILDIEQSIWKLTIVSPLVTIDGPKSYYRRINTINESAKPDEYIVALHDITVSGTDHYIVKAFKQSVLGKAILGNNRFGKNTIGGVYIEDMFLYRMDWNLVEMNLDSVK